MRLSAIILTLLPLTVCAQVTTIQPLGSVNASVVANGMGVNIGDNPMEYVAAAAAGFKYVRIGSCGWQNTEIQNANNTSGGYALASQCALDIGYAKSNGLVPEIEALYGAPYHSILKVTTTAAVSTGSFAVPVAFSSSLLNSDTMANIAYPYDYLYWNTNPFTGNHAYAGSYIASYSASSSTTGTITLASAVTTAIPSGTVLTINEQLYPPAMTGLKTDASVQAYVNYFAYMANAMALLDPGVTVEEGIWNEPPWSGDPWDNRRDLYDSDPGFANELGSGYPNYGFVDALQNYTFAAATTTLPITTLPTTLKMDNDETDKSTAADPRGSRFAASTGGDTFAQPGNNAAWYLSLHPYPNNPEDSAWNELCLAANPSAGQTCSIINVNNAPTGIEQQNLQNVAAHGASWRMNMDLTETGASSKSGFSEVQKAVLEFRENLEMFLSNVSVIKEYRLFEPNWNTAPGSGTTNCQTITGYSLIILNTANVNSACAGAAYPLSCITNADCSTAASYTPLAAYTALAGLLSDAASIAAPPVATCLTPNVTSYSGTYQLATASVCGSIGLQNVYRFYLWQVSQSPTAVGTAVNGTFTVTSVPTASLGATLAVGVVLQGANIPGSTGAPITGQTSGTPGGAGVYTTSCSTCNFSTSETMTSNWPSVTSPAAGTATLAIPSGYYIASVVDAITRTSSAYTLSGSNAILAPTDHPLSIALVPIPQYHRWLGSFTFKGFHAQLS